MYLNYNYGEDGNRLMPLIRISDSGWRRLEEDRGQDCLEQFASSVELFNQAAQRVEEQYPDLIPPVVKFKQIDYPGYFSAPRSHLGMYQVQLDQIVGDGWVCIPRIERRTNPKYTHLANYPKPQKLIRVMESMLGFRLKDALPIELIKIGDHYFVDNGSHRVYAARLLQMTDISANVVEYDYEALKPRLRLLNSNGFIMLGVQKENNDGSYEKIAICPEAIEVLRKTHQIEEIRL